MEKFKAGDKIIVHKPKDLSQFPIWEKQMDIYNGNILTISNVTTDGMLECVESNCYCFHPDWCEKVFIGVDTATGQDYSVTSEVRVETKPMKAGIEMISDEHIERDYPHLKASTLSPQNLSTEIDWEQRKYELAKEFMAAIIAQHITPLRNWDEVVRITEECIEAANEMIKQLKQ
jgi:hypothetical protein